MIIAEIWFDSIIANPAAPDARVSNRGVIYNGHYWDEYLKSVDEFVFEIEQPYGGMAKPSSGTSTFITKTFAASWIPPEICVIKLYYLLDPAAADSAVPLFYGQMQINRLNYLNAVYDLRGDVPNTQVTDVRVNGTLQSVFQDFVTANPGWTLDVSRAPYANNTGYCTVDYYINGTMIYAEVLSELAAAFHHFFTVDPASQIIFLIDMNNSGAAIVIDEHEYHPSNYPWPVLPSYVAVGNQRAFHGAAWFGNATEIEDHSVDVVAGDNDAQRLRTAGYILDTLSKPTPEFKMPLQYVADKNITIGSCLQWQDSRVKAPADDQPLNATMQVRKMTYDTVKEKVFLSGDTELTS